MNRLAGHSIPIFRYDALLVVAIQVELSDSIVINLKEDIGEAIEARPTRGLIIDLTGVDIMDSYISRVIRDIALMAKLMGVRTVISGMQASVAMTMVEMGMDWKNIPTVMDLHEATQVLTLWAKDDAHDKREEYVVLSGDEEHADLVDLN